MRPGRYIDQSRFREVMSHFASGVTVVSTTLHGADFGTTASAFCSLSMEPPMVLVCLNTTSETGIAIAASGDLGVSILHEGQDQLAEQFAGKGQDKFTGVETFRGESGIPLISDALAHVECRVVDMTKGGTHVVFIAAALYGDVATGRPLTYFRGGFGHFTVKQPAAS